MIGALNTPMKRIVRSSMHNQNSRSNLLQHPFVFGACSLLSKPDLVRTMAMLLLLLLLLLLARVF